MKQKNQAISHSATISRLYHNSQVFNSLLSLYMYIHIIRYTPYAGLHKQCQMLRIIFRASSSIVCITQKQ
jgi:hypothetical protein